MSDLWMSAGLVPAGWMPFVLSVPAISKIPLNELLLFQESPAYWPGRGSTSATSET
jgi:hypothetical protein